MKVYDPYAHVTRDLDACETAGYVNGLIPVLSTKDDQWFAVCMFSGDSYQLGDLQSEDLSTVRESIASHLFSKLLLSHCHQGCESDDVPDKGQAILARVDYARRFGEHAVEEAERIAVARGFTADDVGTAYNILEAKDCVVHIPAIKISNLQKEAGR